MAANDLMMAIRVIVDGGKSVAKLAVISAAVATITDAFVEANIEIENLQRGLNALNGGNGSALFEQLSYSANRLGLPLKSVSQSFLELQAATRGTQFEGERTKGIFDALANALTVTGADSVQFNRGFRALTQILSKGQLYAEELRQQMGEALPSAIQDFAQALKISPKDLLKFMESGAIEGNNLYRTLVLVSKQWEKTYKVANESDFTFTQKLAIAQNAINLLFVEIGNTGIWKAFGDGLLLARDAFVELKDATKEYEGYVKGTFQTLRQMAVETSADIKVASDNLGTYLSDVEFSPVGLVRNFKSVFSLLEPEARNALKPVEDAIAGIDLSKITVAFAGVTRAAIESVGILIVSAADAINQIGPLADVVAQAFVTTGAKIKSVYVEITNFIGSKIEEVQATFLKSKVNVRWTQLFGSAEELNALFKQIEGLDQRYIESARAAQDRSTRAQQSYDTEANKLKSLNGIMQSQGSTWAQSTQAAFDGIGERLLQSFNKLGQNQSFINLLVKAQKDANALQKIYDIDLNYQNTLKEQGLKISKEQAKIDKEILDLRQAYQDTMQDINASKYQRWADSGQITKEAADFLIASAKGDAAWKAWSAAQEAVAAYNAEAKKGADANQKTLEALKQQADDQLKYAGAKAKEVGDEYRIKQILEEQIALRERQKALKGSFEQTLAASEAGKPAELPVKPVLEPVPTKLDPAEQNVNRIYADPITTLPTATQYVQRIYTDGSGAGTSEQIHRARGGLIPGGYSNRDSVSALLAPGEFVIPSHIVRALSPSYFYDLIRNGGKTIPQVSVRDNISVPHFAAGGLVQNSQPIVINVGSKAIHLSGSRDAANQLVKLLTQTGRAI